MGYTNIVSPSVSSEGRIEDSLLKIYQIEGEASIVSSKEKKNLGSRWKENWPGKVASRKRVRRQLSEDGVTPLG